MNSHTNNAHLHPAGTVTGIINGSGSITAAIGQLLIPVLYSWGQNDGVGYRYVWFFLVLCTFIGTALMSGKIMKELGYTSDQATLSSSSPSLSAAEMIPLLSTHRSDSMGNSRGRGGNYTAEKESDRMP